LALSLFLLAVQEVSAIGGDHGPGRIPEDYNKEWPKGLPDVINTGERVWGHWVNQGDFFYYRGDAGGLKKFHLPVEGVVAESGVARHQRGHSSEMVNVR
jgi:hypothetical protein